MQQCKASLKTENQKFRPQMIHNYSINTITQYKNTDDSHRELMQC